MSGDSQFSLLCNLIAEHLRPYTELELAYLTKQNEKNLLISLSQVLREIRMISTPNCDSDRDKLHYDDHNCLTKILAQLIPLLAVESQYVQHLTGNVLTVCSEFLAASGSDWNLFNGLLLVCLRLAIANVSSCYVESSLTGAWDLTGDLSSLVVLKVGLKDANWYTVAGIIRVLRNMLKFLKQEDLNQLCEVYLGCISLFLLNLPLVFMDGVDLGQISENRESNAEDDHIGEKDPKVLFLGNFVQLLCALVEQSGAVEGEVGSHDRHSILVIIINAVPKLLCWCLGKKGICAKMPISQYFRHKLLMLMQRLSYQTQLGYSTLLLWLQLLHDYFEELLQKPIAKFGSGCDESLEGSPFSLHLSDGELHRKHSLHLQRQAVFLFLRCCFSLICLTEETSNQYACETVNSNLTVDSVSDLNLGRKKGCSELYRWLQGHFPIEEFVDHEMYLENSIAFSLSFLQLYIHEDDVLFKILLQLFSVPPSSEQQFPREKWAFENVKEDILFHISNLFNPIYLFHHFLAELHYDHQVLLDYLISKDTGTSCAEYLLRSLRTVCESWHLFTRFTMDGKFLDDSSCKKRKILFDGYNFKATQSSPTLKGTPPLLDEEHKRDSEHGCNQCKTNSKAFDEAKDCLLSLKYSVENLHQKSLFPYNPKVLLKRLTKFEELCSNQYEL